MGRNADGPSWEYLGDGYFRDTNTGQTVYKQEKGQGAQVGTLYNMGTTDQKYQPDYGDDGVAQYNEVMNAGRFRDTYGLENTKESGYEADRAYYAYLMAIDPTGRLAGTAQSAGDIPNYLPENTRPYESELFFGGHSGNSYRDPDGVYRIAPGELGNTERQWDDTLYENPPVQGGSRDTSWQWAEPRQQNPAQIAGRFEWGNFPGQDSPWGNEDLPGGNADFYRQQLNNLITQQDMYQQEAVAAGLRAQNQQPQQPQGDPWAWAYGGQGLPDVQTAGPVSYSLRAPYEGLTNYQAVQHALQGMGEDDVNWWNDHMAGKQDDPANNWLTAGDPNILIDRLTGEPDGGLTPQNYQRMTAMFRKFYSPQGGYSGPGDVPTGYAAPINWGAA